VYLADTVGLTRPVEVAPVPAGVSHERSGNATATRPAAVVRAHGLARSSSALPAQWRPIPVDDVEQARLGCAAPDDHRAEVPTRAQRHHRLRRGRPELRRGRDERLGRGPSGVVAQPRGAPRRRRSTGRPAAAPGARAPGNRGERDRLWQRWVAVDPHFDAYAGRRSTETPVVVLEPRDGTA